MRAADLIASLRDRGETVAAAESLTGGLVTGALTAVPGASAVVRGGVVAYATDLKASVLRVDQDLLAAGGAVQPEVAEHMALGVRDLTGATWGLATTGVAGPDPQDGASVGTVYVAVAGGPAGRVLMSRKHVLDGDREAIRAGAVAAVLTLLQEELTGAPLG